MTGAGARADQSYPRLTSPAGYRNPRWSPNGRYLLLADAKREGVYLYDLYTSSFWEITSSPSSGRWCYWSSDSTKIGFKLLVETTESEFEQIPVVYDLDQREIVKLAGPTSACGVPSFANDGKIAFSFGHSIYILGPDFTVLKEFDIGCYANLTPISPDGRWLVYNDDTDRLWLLDLETGNKRCLTLEEGGYFRPVWSPDSRKLAANTFDGKLKVFDILSTQVFDLGYGWEPAWCPDSLYIVFSTVSRSALGKEGDLYLARYDGSEEIPITQTAYEVEVSPDIAATGWLAFGSHLTGKIFIVAPAEEIKPSETGIQIVPSFDFSTLKELDLSSPKKSHGYINPTTAAVVKGLLYKSDAVESIDVPYVHQVYDTPNSFDGRWACSATSALMVIVYYNILPKWPCNVNIPEPHESPFGRYVSDVYAFNGYTYDIWGCDASGNRAYGGYGYIVRQRWCPDNTIQYPHTSEYMGDYLQNHGLNSSVDWTATWSEFTSEINNEFPVIILTKLTSSGHYVVGRGYYANRTVVTNDPFGDANLGDTYYGYGSSLGNYYGEGALYDWPGYNNGHVSLMQCAPDTSRPLLFVYAEGTVNPVVTSSLKIVESSPYCVGETITAQFTLTNKGTAPITFDVVTVGGRDPDNEVADFTWDYNVTLDPNESYAYQGSLTITKAGNYHFFCAYRTPDGVWNTSIPTESGVDSTLDIVCKTSPNQPTGVLATDGTYTDRVRITWNAVSGANRYEVYRATSQYGSYSLIAGNVTTTSYDDTSVSAGQRYWYKVKACNACGCSGYSGADEGWAASNPALCKSTSSLDFGTSATSRTFEVWNCGGGTLNYTISDDRTWISVSPTSGSSTGE
ncbi:hypothetical protein DRO33_02645, partial [Candidatus Bathyarchaeota archaeon]